MDAKKTAKNVRDYFNKQYDKDCMLAGTTLKAVRLNGMPATRSYKNHNEVAFINAAEAEQRLEWLRQALDLIEENFKNDDTDYIKLIELAYIQKLRQVDLAQSWGVTRRKLYDLLLSACIILAGAMKQVSGNRINWIA